jgi:guanine deaminase
MVADFFVLDLRATALMARCMARARTLTEKLLVLITLGDERAVSRTYVLGREMHSAAATCPDSAAHA